MKIHQSFVQRMYESPRDRAVVQSIIDLGRNLGLEVVAEGVTDPGTRRALQEMGCHLAQGYLFTPPMAIGDVPALVRRVGVVGWAPGPASTSVPAPLLPAPLVPAPAPAPRTGSRGLAVPPVLPQLDSLA
jgi:predicted signal transduction protein with EAL and GGDEF domain